MRLHIKNLSPEAHGFIAQDKAKHNHKNLEETVECIIKTASKYESDKQHIIKGLKRYPDDFPALVGWIQETLNISDEEIKGSASIKEVSNNQLKRASTLVDA